MRPARSVPAVLTHRAILPSATNVRASNGRSVIRLNAFVGRSIVPQHN
jgi:hypothetical protein